MFQALICSLLIHAAAAQADSPEARHAAFSDAFTKAVESARSLKEDRSTNAWAFSRYVQCIESIPEPREGDLRTLEDEVEKRDRPSSILAWLVIARSSKSAAAREVLIKQALEGDTATVVAISFASSPYSRQMLEHIVPKPVFLGVTSLSLGLLSHIGDASTLSKLKLMRLNEQRIRVAELLDSAIKCLEMKLSRPDEEHDAWTTMGVAYWRAPSESRPSVRVGKEYTDAAQRLTASGIHFPTDFLKCRVELGQPLAIVLAGEQREATLVEPVRKAAEREGCESEFAIASLGKMGTDEAMEALAGLAKPGDSIRNRDVSRALSQGSKTAEAVIEKFLQNKDYEESWPLFESALSNLRRRLELENKQ